MNQTHYRLNARPAPSLLSIVIPIYNEEQVVPVLRERMTAFLGTLPCAVELVLVNDGSRDLTLNGLLDWVNADPRVRLLNLARNFGQQAAVTAGLDAARGDAVVIMDSDLQDPPELLHRMIEEYCRGYDVVYGQRVRRHGETRFKRFSAWAFYRTMQILIYRDLPADVGDFRLISKRCLEALKAMRETHRFMRGMVAWVGFPQTAVPFVRDPRTAGETKYGLGNMLMLAWTAAVSFSAAPLRASFLLGFALGAIGITQGVYAVARTVLGLYVVPGWTSLMVVLCLIGAAMCISIGVLGEYVGRIFEESKGRPLYIVADEYSAGTRPTQDLIAAASALETNLSREAVRK